MRTPHFRLFLSLLTALSAPIAYAQDGQSASAWYAQVLAQAEKSYSVHFNPRRKFIIVAQVLPDATEFIRSFQKLGVIAAVIPKSSQALHPEILQQWRAAGLPVRDDINRATLENPKNAIAFLRQTVSNSGEFVIIDHSGYFAPAASAIQSAPDLAPKCRGIVDSTKSGTLAYSKAAGEAHPPLLNVYDTNTKTEEGQYIAADFLKGLQQTLSGAKVPVDRIRTIGVIGAGKTGKPIAEGLRHQFGPNVRIIIYDKTDPPSVRAELVTKSDLIISSTGENPLLDSDLRNAKNGVLLASITGVDEELDWPRRIRDGVITRVPEHLQLSTELVPGTRVPYVTTYQAGEKSIHLLLGYPLNYLLNSADPGISRLHGLKLFAATRLLSGRDTNSAALEKDFRQALIGPCTESAFEQILK